MDVNFAILRSEGKKEVKMKVTFMPEGKLEKAAPGENLMDVASRANIIINGVCAGLGTCGKCTVQVLGEAITAPDAFDQKFISSEALKQGYRLACRYEINEAITVVIPEIHGPVTRVKSLSSLPKDFTPDLVAGKPAYGIAFDIGTTTVVAMLWNLNSGEMIGTLAQTNPQSAFGADVISRIHFSSESPENLERMCVQIRTCLNEMIKSFMKTYAINRNAIIRSVVVGNTTMSHLFMLVDPTPLAIAPFTPGFVKEQRVKPQVVDLAINPEGTVVILPNIAGHVGSDMVAVMVYSRADQMENLTVAIDIGTNGEILCAKEGQVFACSTAAGPAFEGANIVHGARATNGVIEGVQIENGCLKIKIIGDGEDVPTGICGSGIIDGIAQLLTHKIINQTGRLISREDGETMKLSPDLVKRLIETDQGRAFVLYEGITITQKDIREVQLAKASIMAGIQIMLNQLDCQVADVDKFILAGAFGTYINKESAIRIGLIPDIGLDKVFSVGNAAGTGACMALLSEKEKERATILAEHTNHIELSTDSEFQTIFLESMGFPEQRSSETE